VTKNQEKLKTATPEFLTGIVNASLAELPKQISVGDAEQAREVFHHALAIVQYGAELRRKLGVDEAKIADKLRDFGLAEID
jgi:hypothetical protein